MIRVLAIAANTLREAVRERIMLLVAVFGLGLLGASQLLSPLTLGEGKKVVTDFGLAGSSLLATLLAVFLGSSLLHKELDRRTIYAVLAKPIGRFEFLLGKFAGLWIATGLLLAAMSGLVLGLLQLFYGDARPILLGSVLLSFVELGIVAAFVVLFSSFTTPTLTACFTLAAIVAGHFAEDLLYFGQQGAVPILAWGTQLVYWMLPHLGIFNARGLVTHDLSVPPERLAFAASYGLLYMTGLLLIAKTVFERREFR